MSENERKRRLDYKKNRMKWILIQIAVLGVVALTIIGLLIAHFNINKTTYINYTEDGAIKYQVQLKDNDFYDEELLPANQVYVATLIDNVWADFGYKLQMDTDDASYEYLYSIKAQLLIRDKNSDVAILDPTYILKEVPVVKADGNKITISESVVIDYDHYHKIASEFIDTYGLIDVSGVLNVTLDVDVVGESQKLGGNSESSYATELQIPLTGKTISIKNVSPAAPQEKVLTCCQDKVNGFKIGAIIAASLEVILIGLFVAFVYLTRNTDINYAIKVKRILSAYRSYIQVISNSFDNEGYQILYVSAFKEMLGIRDTIQSPILMSENEDRTCTQFLIPTNTKILYVFEIKVEDYDEIYHSAPEDSVIITDDVDEDALAEALATPDVDLSEIDYVEDDDKEEEQGVEVVGVVWPEKKNGNKVYRYDPNGEELENGDVVLVPSLDAAKNKDVIRKAAVAHANHKVAPETLHHPLKKIIGVVKRKAEQALTPD